MTKKDMTNKNMTIFLIVDSNATLEFLSASIKEFKEIWKQQYFAELSFENLETNSQGKSRSRGNKTRLVIWIYPYISMQSLIHLHHCYQPLFRRLFPVYKPTKKTIRNIYAHRLVSAGCFYGIFRSPRFGN